MPQKQRKPSAKNAKNAKGRRRAPTVDPNVELGRLSLLTENCVGGFAVPIGVAKHFVINGQPRIVTMATFERTVVAAASKGAKCALATGGIYVHLHPPLIDAQISYARHPYPQAALALLQAQQMPLEQQLFAMAQPMLRAGNFVSIRQIRFVPIVRHDLTADTMIVVDIRMGTDEAMGAGTVTRLAQDFADRVLFQLVGQRPTGVICSNAEAGRRTAASATFTVPGGTQQRDRILDLHKWAEDDWTRAVTHNKGIMNGVSAVALATGQDVQAIEASAHVQAARMPLRYGPLTTYAPLDDDKIEARLDLHLPVGSVGGGTGHPAAAKCRELMQTTKAEDIAAAMAATGLAQNFAALLCLSGEGIVEANKRVRGMAVGATKAPAAAKKR